MNQEQTIREKLEEIRPDLNSKEFKDIYDKMYKKNKGAEMYDNVGLDFTLDYILSDQTQDRLKRVKKKDWEKLNNDTVAKKKILDQALNFLD